MPMEPLDDLELSEILRAWEAPSAPLRLRERMFSRGPWWRSVWRAEIRVPVPLAACLALLAGLGYWIARPAPLPQKEAVTFRQLRPVEELKPRIIRRARVQN
jgi:hypothetical protein